MQNITNHVVRLFKECRVAQPDSGLSLDLTTTALPTEASLDEACPVSYIRETVERFLASELRLFENSAAPDEHPHKNSTNSSDTRDWTMANSVLYATTVITTIGKRC